jgi:hypothetical protein
VLPWDRARHRDPLGVPILGRGIFPLISIQLEKPKNLLVSIQRLDEDKVVTRSIRSVDHGIII